MADDLARSLLEVDGAHIGFGFTLGQEFPELSNSNCVEAASLPDGTVGVRHSRNPEGPVLRFTGDEWQAFLGGVLNGEFGGFGQ